VKEAEFSVKLMEGEQLVEVRALRFKDVLNFSISHNEGMGVVRVVVNEGVVDREFAGKMTQESLLLRSDRGRFGAVSVTLGELSFKMKELRPKVDGYTFRYVDQGRWGGWWRQPNYAAAVISAVAAGLLGVVIWGWMRGMKNRWLWVLWGVGLIGAVVSYGILLKTYSRGGWLSYGVMAGIMLWFLGGFKRWQVVLGVLVLWGVGVSILPRGWERVGSSAQVAEDKSIANRFEYWQAAVVQMGVNDWRGVGSGKFGEFYRRWMADKDNKEDNFSAISDFFTLISHFGVGGCWLWVSGMLLLILLLVELRGTKHLLYWMGLVMLLGYGLNGVFSTLYHLRSVWGYYVGWVILLIGLGWWWRVMKLKKMGVLVLVAAVGAVVISGGMMLCSERLARESLLVKEGKWIEAERRGETFGHCVYVDEKWLGRSGEDVVRYGLRPWVEQGVKVTFLKEDKDAGKSSSASKVEGNWLVYWDELWEMKKLQEGDRVVVEGKMVSPIMSDLAAKKVRNADRVKWIFLNVGVVDMQAIKTIAAELRIEQVWVNFFSEGGKERWLADGVKEHFYKGNDQMQVWTCIGRWDTSGPKIGLADFREKLIGSFKK
jgi:hypothetical protein